ncbi:MAG: transcriptional regulator NrdR [Phycisphaerae bacterium]|nr:transcriptional regulator NrdR [Phycisphaerae bacterium]
MQCPYCGHNDDKVVDSRSSEGGRSVRRRRECRSCSRRFTTYERPEEGIRQAVIKKDGSREPYNRQKLIDGLEKACYKRRIRQEQIRQIVERTEDAIFRGFDRDVPSTFIGDCVAGELQKLDKIAYIRFASVYQNYANVEDLIHEATDVQRSPVVGPDQRDLFEEPD